MRMLANEGIFETSPLYCHSGKYSSQGEELKSPVCVTTGHAGSLMNLAVRGQEILLQSELFGEDINTKLLRAGSKKVNFTADLDSGSCGYFSKYIFSMHPNVVP
jgi:hypothetical protein